MLFEPTPIETPGSGGWRRLAAVALPVAILVAVVGASVVANGPDRATTPDLADASPAAIARAGEASAPAPSASPGRPASAATAVRYPSATYGLPVRGVGATLDRIDGGLALATDLVAVRGWLTIRPDGSACASSFGPPALEDELCRETGVLRDDPTPVFEWAGTGVQRTSASGPELDPLIPPGVARWGIDVNKVAPNGDGDLAGPIVPIPVVLVGRYSVPRLAACLTEPGCGLQFTTERIVWVDGSWQTQPVVQAVAPERTGLDVAGSRQIALDAFPGPTILLSQALVPGSMLGRLDPDAAAAMLGTQASRVSVRVWYLRVMSPAATGPGMSPAIGWIAIDDATGRILGRRDAA